MRPSNTPAVRQIAAVTMLLASSLANAGQLWGAERRQPANAAPADPTAPEQLESLPLASPSASADAGAPCASNDRLSATLQPLSAIAFRLAPEGKILPGSCISRRFPEHAERRSEERSRWSESFEFQWAASELSHNPLYFEDLPLERYGLAYPPAVQPAVSAANFLADAFTLPYQMGLDPPHARIYTLGYERPGNCAPGVRKHLPWSFRGALMQAGAVVGSVYMFP